MAARFPSYLLADSEAGARKESEIAGTAPARRRFRQRIDRGFVLQRVPHITLKSIANNAEIDAISEQWQGQLAPLLQRLNGALDAAWTEWEVPREPDEAWPAEANEAHGAWWQARRNRQKAIEMAIARKAAALVFHDRPYEDSAKVRVAGPFTVESLSPHRGPGPDGGTNAPAVSPAAGDAFVRAVLDHLKGAGLQNTGSGERLEITELKLRAGGCHVNAEGRYQAKGREKRVAVAIGPQYGTVSQGLVCAAAREAARRFDTLVVCGFAFAPQLDEASPVGVGRLTVLKARMNQDLHMAEHLRATGAGKLFVVSGEPDIRVEARPDGRVTVEVVGIALFDPASGEMRAASADDVACWFVDSDYDGERFCVRQAYVLGGNDPYRKLKRALKAEIDEATWASLQAARSRPFPKPASSRIAVKVVSHTGDEALRIIEVR
jgi:adenine-specific DNA-methyltransferase